MRTRVRAALIAESASSGRLDFELAGETAHAGAGVNRACIGGRSCSRRLGRRGGDRLGSGRRLGRLARRLVRRTVRGRDHVLSLDAAPLADAAAWIAHYQRFWEQRLEALDELGIRPVAIAAST